MKLNIGCASRPIDGWVNIDMDTIDEIKERYPNIEIPNNIEVYQYDIFNLPYDDNTIDEIKADAFLEHLSFIDEKRFFLEVGRVLKDGGIFDVSVPDFDAIVNLWQKADDDWKDFYQDDEKSIAKQHWFGNYSYSTRNKWGYLTAMIFGSQNGEGQYHKNCYTQGKIKAIFKFLNISVSMVERYDWKGDRDPMLRIKGVIKK